MTSWPPKKVAKLPFVKTGTTPVYIWSESQDYIYFRNLYQSIFTSDGTNGLEEGQQERSSQDSVIHLICDAADVKHEGILDHGGNICDGDTEDCHTELRTFFSNICEWYLGFIIEGLYKPLLTEMWWATRWWKLPRRRQIYRQLWPCVWGRRCQRAPGGSPPGRHGCLLSPGGGRAKWILDISIHTIRLPGGLDWMNFFITSRPLMRREPNMKERLNKIMSFQSWLGAIFTIFFIPQGSILCPPSDILVSSLRVYSRKMVQIFWSEFDIVIQRDYVLLNELRW